MLTKAYDDVFKNFDLIAMPTLPLRAYKLPDSSVSHDKYIELALNMVTNTCPFDVTGHPAMTVPCGNL